MKKLLGITFTIKALLALWIGVAFYYQNPLYQDRPGEPVVCGLEDFKPPSKVVHTSVTNWQNLLPDHLLTKWWWILSNEEIATYTETKYAPSDTSAYHDTRTTIFATYLNIFQNQYGAEINVFKKHLPDSLLIELTVIHHASYQGQASYCSFDLDTIDLSVPWSHFDCVGIIDGSPHENTATSLSKGNIDQVQMQIILQEWGLLQ